MVLFPFPLAGAGVLGGGGVAGLLVLSLARPEVDALLVASLAAPEATGGLAGVVGGELGFV
jgi:hypothetical protein